MGSAELPGWVSRWRKRPFSEFIPGDTVIPGPGGKGAGAMGGLSAIGTERVISPPPPGPPTWFFSCLQSIRFHGLDPRDQPICFFFGGGNGGQCSSY